VGAIRPDAGPSHARLYHTRRADSKRQKTVDNGGTAVLNKALTNLNRSKGEGG